MRLQTFSRIASLALAGLLTIPATLNAAPPVNSQELARADVPRGLHQDPQWEIIRPHLPDPATATAGQLETAADVLRARRFPEDALEYYNYALKRGGAGNELYNKIGVLFMELHQYPQARVSFKAAIAVKKNDARAWNNLGALDYISQNYGSAISEYKRAIRLNKKSAIFHSNLATTYIEQKDYDSARPELIAAVTLDPSVFHRGGTGGSSAHILTPGDRARFCFEMARIYAARGEQALMLHYLAMAKEAGFDLANEMSNDAQLGRFRKDPRVVAILKNADMLMPTPDVPPEDFKPLE